LSGRVVVVSPHLDDAALSLGGTLASAVRGGADARVVTVFAGDPASEGDAAPWDRGCGFPTAGEAARGRREEDRRACAALGCTPRWLSFSSVQYVHEERSTDGVWKELAPELAQADLILVPGFPLIHPDHRWLCGLLTGRLGRDSRIRYFVEQPYAGGNRPREGTELEIAGPVTWTAPRLGFADRRARGRACRAYRSQFRGRAHLPRRLLLPEVFPVEELVGRPAR
jgi:LmbE family N-acetylglucosaminyl deacetylase